MKPTEEKKEQADAEQLSSPSSAVIYKAILQEGVDELARPTSTLFPIVLLQEVQ